MTDTATITAATAGIRPGRLRLDWLDALRGFAALVVVWFHLGPYVLGDAAHEAVLRYIDLGKYGVLLFFVVSGYVIPMSLERRGSLRQFWIGRIFRIYPAFLAAAGAMTLLIVVGVLDLTTSLQAETTTGILAHLTMMQDVLGLRGVVRVFWTLSYEMIFYLIVAGLFAWNLHRHSAIWAAGLALVAVVVGPRLPDSLFTPDAGSRRVVAAALVLVVAASLVGYLTGRRGPVLAAGALGIAVVSLPALNGSPTEYGTAIASWDSLSFIAVMFGGTVIYRVHHGQMPRTDAVASLAVIVVSVVGTQWLYFSGGAHGLFDVTGNRLSWATTVIAVVLTFALAFHCRLSWVPRAFVRLGTVSYSTYLLHPIVLALFRHWLPNPSAAHPVVVILIGAGFVAVTAAVSWLSWRFVEQPGIAVGKRLGLMLDTRFGAEHAVEPAASSA